MSLQTLCIDSKIIQKNIISLIIESCQNELDENQLKELKNKIGHGMCQALVLMWIMNVLERNRGNEIPLESAVSALNDMVLDVNILRATANVQISYLSEEFCPWYSGFISRISKLCHECRGILEKIHPRSFDASILISLGSDSDFCNRIGRNEVEDKIFCGLNGIVSMMSYVKDGQVKGHTIGSIKVRFCDGDVQKDKYVTYDPNLGLYMSDSVSEFFKVLIKKFYSVPDIDKNTSVEIEAINIEYIKQF
jgi:hypothetical protein